VLAPIDFTLQGVLRLRFRRDYNSRLERLHAIRQLTLDAAMILTGYIALIGSTSLTLRYALLFAAD
jgi:hypothetical protein